MSKLASTWMGSGVLAAVMSVALGARGQTPAVEDVPTAALPPVEATAEPPASPTAPDEAQAQAAVPTGAVACVVEPNGIDAASAATAGRLVCEQLRARHSQSQAGGAGFRVRLDRLGRSVLVTVSYEAPLGHPVRSRRMTLASLEEITVAAPRLATAVVLDQPLEDTQHVDNLVGEETREYKKKPGEFLWGIGLLGASVPTGDLYMAPGFELTGFYETPRFGFGFSGRFGGADRDDSEYSFASLSLGARYFMSEGDFSPFVGGGVELLYLNVNQADGGGLGAYGEVGVEMLRLHGSRFTASLRVEAPFFGLEGTRYDGYGPTPDPIQRYDVPITLGLGYAW